MKRILSKMMCLLFAAAFLFSGCSKNESGQSSVSSGAVQSSSAAQPQDITIRVAAAASLEKTFTEKIIPAFNKQYPHIKVEGVYDSSGKLQTQIEEGLGADVFMSAAKKQMQALTEQGYVNEGDIVDLLENKIVLIKTTGSGLDITDFSQITEVNPVALGDPESVPAGQYAKEALETLGLWEEVSANASFATNVTEVLNWVAEGSAEAGIVYATDAAQTEDVTIVAEAPEGSLAEKVIYPVAPLANSQHSEQAVLFVEFLQSGEALDILKEAGFTPNI